MFKAGFLTIQHFVILPSAEPFYAYAKGNQTVATSASETESSLPNRLIIPDQKIDLPILPSSKINGEWQVSTQGVSMMPPDQFSDEKPGYVFFGHDWQILLGKMRQSTIGQTVTLSYGSKKTDTYKIISVFKVAPNQASILNLAQPNTILIYTCSGFMDSQRFVVLAQLQ